MSTLQHTCEASGKSNCQLCMALQVDLWDAINSYAISVGGDPSGHVYGNGPRMQAVADVNRVVDRVTSRQKIDDIVIGELVKGSNAAAAAACDRGNEIQRLRGVLSEVGLYLRSVAVRTDSDHRSLELFAKADDIERALAESMRESR